MISINKRDYIIEQSSFYFYNEA